jgi:hypothetical protein
MNPEKTKIKLHELIPEEFAKALLKGEVVIPEIGTFHLTRYQKRFHPLMLNGQRTKKMKSVFIKKKDLILIGFKPHVRLKKRIKGN